MRALGAVLLLSVCPTGALAQPGDDHATLAGPMVHEPRTIVRRDLFGVLQRPEETPEEAAAAELDLTDPERKRVEKVFLHRMRLIDACVASHADLIAVLQKGAGDAGALERVGLVSRFVEAFEPMRLEQTLWEQVRAALPGHAAPEFDRMMIEYWDAVASDGRDRAPGVIERFAITSKERMAILGREVERSFRTLGDSGSLTVRALTGGLDLSDSQRSQLHIMAGDYDEMVAMSPSEDQKRGLVLKVLSILAPDQRDEILRKFTDR